jgi:hypothetical protein
MLNPLVLRVQEILIFKTLSLSIANHNTMQACDGVEMQLQAFITSNWITKQRISVSGDRIMSPRLLHISCGWR